MTLASPYIQQMSSFAKIWWKMGHRASKNGASSIWTTENLMTSRTPLTIVLSKSNEFDNIAEKNTLTIVQALWTIFSDFKIFAEMAHHLIKFDEKHNGNKLMSGVRGPYDQPVSSYAKILCKNGAQRSQKWC